MLYTVLYILHCIYKKEILYIMYYFKYCIQRIMYYITYNIFFYILCII